MIKRTISGMIGKGSISHNERKFIAQNVDADRTAENMILKSENIKDVYHELFDEALERYNAKQTRKDREIKDYYEHIRTGKQEKLFHEVIFQIGNKDDTGCLSEEGQIARSVLIEFAKEFEIRNPQFRVFGMYLHMDEATPHLHIDFVPYTTESNRGLDTRVSLKKALAMQGFKSKSKGNTEWNQWMELEKEELARMAERHDIQWDKKGTHKEHLSVLDFKKEMRTQEVKELENQVDQAKSKVEKYEKKLDHLQPIIDNMSKEIEEFSASMDELLPKSGTLETGSKYREKKAKPFCTKMKKRISSLAAAYTMVKEELGKIQRENRKLVEENKHLKEQCRDIKEENKELKKVNNWFDIVVKVLGRSNIDRVIERFQERERLEAEEKAKKDRMQKPVSIKERLAENQQIISQNQKKKKTKHKGMER